MKYERLTVHSAKGLKLKKGKKFVELLSDKNLTLSALNRLAELEDKIESGEMLGSPKIYQLSVGCKGTSLETYFIDEIAAKLTSINGMWSLEYKDRLCGNGGRKLIGYFTDKYQAEAKLKELQGE